MMEEEGQASKKPHISMDFVTHSRDSVLHCDLKLYEESSASFAAVPFNTLCKLKWTGLGELWSIRSHSVLFVHENQVVSSSARPPI